MKLGWSHEQCCGAEEEDDDFVCDLCQCINSKLGLPLPELE